MIVLGESIVVLTRTRGNQWPVEPMVSSLPQGLQVVVAIFLGGALLSAILPPRMWPRVRTVVPVPVFALVAALPLVAGLLGPWSTVRGERLLSRPRSDVALQLVEWDGIPGKVWEEVYLRRIDAAGEPTDEIELVAVFRGDREPVWVRLVGTDAIEVVYCTKTERVTFRADTLEVGEAAIIPNTSPDSGAATGPLIDLPLAGPTVRPPSERSPADQCRPFQAGVPAEPGTTRPTR